MNWLFWRLFEDQLLIDLVSHSERCKLKEVNGFLKAKCEEISSILTIFKCAFSDEYYYRLAPLTNIQLDPMINSTCPDDPYGYQASIFKGNFSWKLN